MGHAGDSRRASRRNNSCSARRHLVQLAGADYAPAGGWRPVAHPCFAVREPRGRLLAGKSTSGRRESCSLGLHAPRHVGGVTEHVDGTPHPSFFACPEFEWFRRQVKGDVATFDLCMYGSDTRRRTTVCSNDLNLINSLRTHAEPPLRASFGSCAARRCVGSSSGSHVCVAAGCACLAGELLGPARSRCRSGLPISHGTSARPRSRGTPCGSRSSS